MNLQDQFNRAIQRLDDAFPDSGVRLGLHRSDTNTVAELESILEVMIGLAGSTALENAYHAAVNRLYFLEHGHMVGWPDLDIRCRALEEALLSLGHRPAD